MITVYSQPNCVQCAATYKKLEQLGLPFTTIDITVDLEAREYVLSLGFKQAPVVVTSEGEMWSGYVPSKIHRLTGL